MLVWTKCSVYIKETWRGSLVNACRMQGKGSQRLRFLSSSSWKLLWANTSLYLTSQRKSLTPKKLEQNFHLLRLCSNIQQAGLPHRKSLLIKKRKVVSRHKGMWVDNDLTLRWLET